jgi:hypothetical protein
MNGVIALKNNQAIPYFRPKQNTSYHLIFPDLGKGFQALGYTEHLVLDDRYHLPKRCTGYNCEYCHEFYPAHATINEEYTNWKLEYEEEITEHVAKSKWRELRSGLRVLEPRKRYDILAVDKNDMNPIWVRMGEKTFDEKFNPAVIQAIRASYRWAELLFEYIGEDMMQATANLNITPIRSNFRILNDEKESELLVKLSTYLESTNAITK